jgi:hypothetical protein
VHAAGIAQPWVGEGIGGHQVLLAVDHLLQDGLADIGFRFFDFGPVSSAPQAIVGFTIFIQQD